MIVDDFSFEGASPSSGDDSQVVTPVPMPNTEVKHLNAESSWGLPPVRIGRCQASKRPICILQVGFSCKNTERNDVSISSFEKKDQKMK